jgi:hypothetical protein
MRSPPPHRRCREKIRKGLQVAVAKKAWDAKELGTRPHVIVGFKDTKENGELQFAASIYLLDLEHLQGKFTDDEVPQIMRYFESMTTVAMDAWLRRGLKPDMTLSSLPSTCSLSELRNDKALIKLSGKLFQDHCTIERKEGEGSSGTMTDGQEDGDTDPDEEDAFSDDENFDARSEKDEESDDAEEEAAATKSKHRRTRSLSSKRSTGAKRSEKMIRTAVRERAAPKSKDATPAAQAAIVIPPSPLPPALTGPPHPADVYTEKAFDAKLYNSPGGDTTSLPVVLCKRVFEMPRTGKYQLPHGRVGHQLTAAMANIVSSVACGRIRSEWIIIFEAVIYQRDKTVIGNKDIRALLQRRLEYWSKKEFLALLEDAERCARQLQGHASTSQESSEDRIAIFTRLVSQNKSSAALRFLLQEDTGGVLDPDVCAHDREHPTATVEEILRLKHPTARLPPAEAFLDLPKDDNGEELPLPTMMKVTGTADLVETVARKMQSRATGGGPGSLDSSSWCAMLLHFGSDSEKLREAVARLLEHVANGILPWEELRALCANRLVPLDKKPGVRPIGVGHVLKRVLAKCMLALTKADIEEVCGNEQLCAGASNGTEAAIHAMNSSYIKSCLRRAEHDGIEDMEDVGDEQQQEGSAKRAPERRSQQHDATDDGVEEQKGSTEGPTEDEAWGFLKVDADNAFNQCSIAPALWHARRFWPRCARFLFNTYRGHTILVLYKPHGKPSILYREDGTTQGDPLAMALYGLGQLPLIRHLRDSMGEESDDFIQAWMADDSSAQGKLTDLVHWFTLLKEHGPKYGYYAKPAKCTVVVEYKYAEAAHACFDSLRIPVAAGAEYLGGFIGFPGSFEQQNYLTEKTAQWEQAVVLLAEVAKQAPQAAYVVMTKCLYPKWEYTQRVTSFPNSSDHLFADLGKAIKEKFIPALFGVQWKEQPLDQLESQEQHLRECPVWTTATLRWPWLAPPGGVLQTPL